MEMINRLTADALDSAEFVKRLKAMEQQHFEEVEKALMGDAPTGTVYGGTENRQQRRARERAERNAAQRAAKARP